MATVTQKVPQLGSELSSSDDNAMIMKQILATHARDSRQVDVKPFLQIIEDIFERADDGIPSIFQETQGQSDALDEKARLSNVTEMLELLSYTIRRISCEISCKCSGSGDIHATIVRIFNILSSYSWDSKVVLALAAFAVSYGEFWLVVQLQPYPNNPLAKGVAFLEKLPEILERAESLKPKFEALNNLVKCMLDVTKCIHGFIELTSRYSSPDTPELATPVVPIPRAVYWTIRGIVACASEIMGLIRMGHEFIASTTEACELSSLAHELNTIHSYFGKQLTPFRQQIGKQEEENQLIRESATKYKSDIVMHPLYEQLLSAHVACLRDRNAGGPVAYDRCTAGVVAARGGVKL